jgi:hypothetical protein
LQNRSWGPALLVRKELTRLPEDHVVNRGTISPKILVGKWDFRRPELEHFSQQREPFLRKKMRTFKNPECPLPRKQIGQRCWLIALAGRKPYDTNAPGC